MHRPITREYSGEDKSSAFRADKGKLVNLMFEYQSLTVRANYTTQQMYIEGKPVDALFDGMRGFAGQLAPAIPSTAQTIRNLADTYEAKDKKTSLVSAGAIYDPGSWLIQGEWTRRTSDSFLADETAWYLNGGYRFGHFTPYIGLSAVKCDSERKSTGIPLTGLTGVALGTAMYLNTALDGLLLKAAEDQKSWTAGVRWDFMRNLDLKLQFDRVLPQHNSNGTFTVPPGVVRQKNRAATIVTAAIDFVF